MMINQLVSDTEEKTYYEKDFLLLLESHLNYLRTNKPIKFIQVTDAINYKFVGDFYGLLHNYFIEKKYHYIVTRFNHYKNSNDYKGDLITISLPDFNTIEFLKNLYMTKNN